MSGTATVKRRGGHYPARVSVTLKTETKAAIDRASDRYRLAAGLIAREAIERGLRPALDALRKQARQEGRQNDDDENGL